MGEQVVQVEAGVERQTTKEVAVAVDEGAALEEPQKNRERERRRLCCKCTTSAFLEVSFVHLDPVQNMQVW